MRNFTGKVAVITGAGSGIGRALAVGLATQGARLALSDVDEAGVAETARSCDKIGARARSYALDVSDRDAVHTHADEVLADFGEVNLVFNNAGVAVTGTVAEMSWQDIEWIVDTNFWGVVHGTKAFLPHLISSGDGHLVNLSSVFGLIGVPTQSAYNATKFAVRGFTESLRQEMRLAGRPVGVSCVHPGGIKTAIARNSRASSGRSTRELAGSFDRIARTAPEEAAGTILRGVRRDRARILVGTDAHAIDALPRLLGSWYQHLVTSVSKRGGLG
ncbi:NAD(P)-dependent dehydrogenase (short-subunit alcohol dehydrogenase family) [Saccharopolyspora lacisalsi]|uniref:NAD(P)-dependent dehydrogenase (Short-subunit alcohol dehydrogenase family) n=1 Tax=Halosaccharopolyspora lacisalsi TaxID=1000566 RepID=A0A839DUL6_9PSEU|nr:SDR family NAD(P)-dependent oxidoreductase [Halosaccharopolyspora lacisalsi]MBA8824449.1 NAD(P)-dependent dehydrogenase (short-subunit alcohol dehydrogenase family) [Halosaccharopolyspora lacisalsi]